MLYRIFLISPEEEAINLRIADFLTQRNGRPHFDFVYTGPTTRCLFTTATILNKVQANMNDYGVRGYVPKMRIETGYGPYVMKWSRECDCDNPEPMLEDEAKHKYEHITNQSYTALSEEIIWTEAEEDIVARCNVVLRNVVQELDRESDVKHKALLICAPLPVMAVTYMVLKDEYLPLNRRLVVDPLRDDGGPVTCFDRVGTSTWEINFVGHEIYSIPPTLEDLKCWLRRPMIDALRVPIYMARRGSLNRYGLPWWYWGWLWILIVGAPAFALGQLYCSWVPKAGSYGSRLSKTDQAIHQWFDQRIPTMGAACVFFITMFAMHLFLFPAERVDV